MKIVRSKYFPILVIISFISLLYWSLGPMKTVKKKLFDASGSTEMLDLKPGASVKQIYQYLNNLGDPGLHVLKEMYYFYDLIFPIVYGLFFSSLLLLLITRIYPHNQKAFWFTTPIMVMLLFDYFENFSICYLIDHLDRVQPISFYLSAFTTIKWISGLITFSIIVYLVFLFLYRKWKKKA